MNIFHANISDNVFDFFKKNLNWIFDFQEVNQSLLNVCGIRNFFENQEDFEALKEFVLKNANLLKEPDRTEYGDFQTNSDLAEKVAIFLKENLAKPQIIVEPTCGKGAFILAALKTFKKVEKIYAVEIYKPYVWETKFSILHHFLENPTVEKPEIAIFHKNVFDFDFKSIACENSSKKILIIGNPPWVTNSKLSVLESTNLPTKSNFKNASGIEAITGKGNFDIGEYITLMMLEAFQNSQGKLAFLVKNSVIKNIVSDQKQRNFRISDLQKHSIDSKREFNVSVEASLFTCDLNGVSEYDCEEFDFYKNSVLLNRFGWVGAKFVSDIDHYESTNAIDGICQFEWRQGVKHDCSAIMEFDRVNGHFKNGRDEEFSLEEDLVFGLLKSSDLKSPVINKTRKFTIITQRKTGQETKTIESNFPKTFSYLSSNKEQFEARKSSIYKNKPPFSIFGIGDYSFKSFKVSISGLYKTFDFKLVLPQNGKPVMLDDTCYFLGFDKLEHAVFTAILLNSETSKHFLQSITFPDAKRTFTKDVLMRIDLLKLASSLTESALRQELDRFSQNENIHVDFDEWHKFLKVLMPDEVEQMGIF
ncbi:MAG: hypothetical protein V4642_08600 [Bacteroidota bacterium]